MYHLIEVCVFACVCTVCVDQVPVVALAIVLFDLQCDSEGVEVAVRWTGQCSVSDVCWP